MTGTPAALELGGDDSASPVSLERADVSRGRSDRQSAPWKPFTHALRLDRVAVMMLIVFGVAVYVGQSVTTNTPDHGDWWTDMNIVSATERISEHGFWTTRFALPLDDGFILGAEPYLYANWPTAPFELQAFAHRLGWEPRQVRILPVLETVTAGYALFCLARVLADRRVAIFSLLFFVTAAPVRLLADSFGYVPIDLLGRFSAFLLVAATATIDASRHRAAWCLGLALSACAVAANAVFLGFESFPAACIFAFGYPILRSARDRSAMRRAAVAAIAVPAVGVVLAVVGRLFFIAMLPGPVGDDLAQVRNSANARFQSGHFSNTFWQEWSHRVWVYLPILLVIALLSVLFAAGEGALKRRYGRMLLCGLLVLAAESAWLLAAREHSHRHVHTIALLMASLTLPAGWLMARVTAPLAGVRLGRAAVAVVALVGSAVILRDPGLRTYGNVTAPIDWSAAEAEIAQLRAQIPPDAVVGLSASVNGNGPLLSFMVDRPLMLLPNAGYADLLDRRPIVFIYRRDFPDAASADTVAAGAITLAQTQYYEALGFTGRSQVPRSLDADG